MAVFRNVSNSARMIPKGSPTLVEPDGLFTVPDELAEQFEAQPYFKPASLSKPKSPTIGKGE